ncbi:MAG: response regulator [Elusimicrobiota bacterium]|nr:response regulator [Elusimicrobiota bacterium]
MTGRRKILVVDDDSSIREILSTQLARLGYDVELACDGQEGLDAFKAAPPDLVLMDVMMPVLDGLTACQKMRAAERKGGRRVPILFLTARDSRHDKTSAALSGGDDFVPKPVSIDELRERLDAALRKNTPKPS